MASNTCCCPNTIEISSLGKFEYDPHEPAAEVVERLMDWLMPLFECAAESA